MKITTKPVKGKELSPGDLFSSEGDAYWQHRNPGSIGEKVYIRTDTLLTSQQEEEEIFQVIIEL